jgi:hypothetical protein
MPGGLDAPVLLATLIWVYYRVPEYVDRAAPG